METCDWSVGIKTLKTQTVVLVNKDYSRHDAA